MAYAYNGLGIAKKNDNESIREMLSVICDFDADFIGDNGDDYLWEVAKGYDSNCDYLIDEVMDDSKYPTIEDKVKEFVGEFYRSYDGYYNNCNYKIIDNGDEVIVSVVATDVD